MIAAVSLEAMTWVTGAVASRHPSPAQEVQYKDHQRHHELQMDQCATDVKAESQQPQNPEND
jgi:hypothetical protein